jgi:hypothetical protein
MYAHDGITLFPTYLREPLYVQEEEEEEEEGRKKRYTATYNHYFVWTS